MNAAAGSAPHAQRARRVEDIQRDIAHVTGEIQALRRARASGGFRAAPLLFWERLHDLNGHLEALYAEKRSSCLSHPVTPVRELDGRGPRKTSQQDLVRSLFGD